MTSRVFIRFSEMVEEKRLVPVLEWKFTATVGDFSIVI